jgi:hypothetical protein
MHLHYKMATSLWEPGQNAMVCDILVRREPTPKLHTAPFPSSTIHWLSPLPNIPSVPSINSVSSNSFRSNSETLYSL